MRPRSWIPNTAIFSHLCASVRYIVWFPSFRFAFSRTRLDFLRMDLRIHKIHLVAVHTPHEILGHRNVGRRMMNEVTPRRCHFPRRSAPSFIGWSRKATKRGYLWLVPVCMFALGAECDQTSSTRDSSTSPNSDSTLPNGGSTSPNGRDLPNDSTSANGDSTSPNGSSESGNAIGRPSRTGARF